MVIKNFSIKKKFKETIVFQQEGNIWRLLIDSDSITGETRNTEDKTSRLFSLNYKTCEVYFKNKELEEKWWFALSGQTKDKIFISRYVQPDLPIQAGIVTLDKYSGDLLWDNKKHSYFFNDETRIFSRMHSLTKDIYFELKTKDGEILKEFHTVSDIEALLSLRQFSEDRQCSDNIYPESVNIVGADLSFIGYLNKKGRVIHSNIESIEFGDYIIYSYFLRSVNSGNQKKDNELIITGKNKKKIFYRTIVNKNISGFVPDSFIVRNGYLIFVREKKELVIINLNNENHH